MKVLWKEKKKNQWKLEEPNFRPNIDSKELYIMVIRVAGKLIIDFACRGLRWEN